jgi:hypothetical protein
MIIFPGVLYGHFSRGTLWSFEQIWELYSGVLLYGHWTNLGHIIWLIPGYSVFYRIIITVDAVAGCTLQLDALLNRRKVAGAWPRLMATMLMHIYSGVLLYGHWNKYGTYIRVHIEQLLPWTNTVQSTLTTIKRKRDIKQTIKIIVSALSLQ